MSFKKQIKQFVPDKLWTQVRKQLILREQKRVGKICDKLIGDYYAGKLVHFPIHPKKQFANERIIWQYWGQGFDDMPEIVRICLKSVECHKGDYQLVRITDSDLADYVDFPEEIYQKRTAFSKAHFSDLLRCVLLSTYGGVWLDATLLLTGPLPEKYFTQGFFMFQRDDKETHQINWEKNFVHYWGWYKGFKVKVFNSLIYSERGNQVIVSLCDMLYNFWLKEQSLPHYFFFQILFNELMEKYPQLNCPIVNDCLPHYATQTILDNFLSISFHDALELSTVHKASYKMSEADIAQLKKLLMEEGKYPY